MYVPQLTVMTTAAIASRAERRRSRSNVRQPRPGAQNREQHQDRDEGPHDAVSEDLDRTGRLEQRQVQREQAPEEVRSSAVRDAVT